MRPEAAVAAPRARPLVQTPGTPGQAHSVLFINSPPMEKVSGLQLSSGNRLTRLVTPAPSESRMHTAFCPEVTHVLDRSLRLG